MHLLARRRWLACASGLGLAPLLRAAQATPGPVWLLLSERGGAYQEAAAAALAELVRVGLARERLRELTVAEWEAAPLAQPAPALVLALGSAAVAAVLRRRIDARVLATLVPRAGLERLARAGGGPVPANWSALYLDQPAERMLNLLRLSLPKARRVGVLWSEQSQPLLPELEQAARARGLRLMATQVRTGEPVFNDLRKVLEESDVLLALPDPNIYNSNSIQNILLTAYRAQVPLIGFSPAYVRAGSLLAVYSSPAQIGAQAARLGAQWLAQPDGPAPAPQAPLEFSVGVNEYVARSLGLELDAPSLEQALRRLEKKP